MSLLLRIVVVLSALAAGCDDDPDELWTATEQSHQAAVHAVGVGADGSVYAVGTIGRDLFARRLAPEGTPLWDQRVDVDGHTDVGHALAIDDDGGVIVAGKIEPSFDNSDSWSRVSFVHRYSSIGSWGWTLSGEQGEVAQAVAVQPDGGVVIAINREYTPTLRLLDPELGVTVDATLTDAGSDSELLALVADDQGNLFAAGRWVHQGVERFWCLSWDPGLASRWHTLRFDGVASGIAVLDGDVVVVGLRRRDDGGSAWIQRLEGSSGVSLWEVEYSPASERRANAVAVDGSDLVYVAGHVVDDGDRDAWIVALDDLGNERAEWSFDVGGEGSTTALAIAVDPGDGTLLVGGSVDESELWIQRRRGDEG